MRLEIDVRMADDAPAWRRWLMALWWPALLLAQVVLVLCGVRHIDDGDPAVRFASAWDLAYVLALTAAITLEARRGIVALVRHRA